MNCNQELPDNEIADVQADNKRLRERCEKAEAAHKNANEIAGKYEDRWLAEKQLREMAEAAAGEMHRALMHGITYLQCDECVGLEFCSACKRTHGVIVDALSSDCGEGWMSPEQVDAGVAGMKMAIAELRNDRDSLQAKEREAYDRFDCSQKKLAAAVEALKKIASCPIVIRGDCPSIASETIDKINL